MDFYQVHVLPDNAPNHILVTYHYGNGQLLESTDGGLTWLVHSVPWGTSHYILSVNATTWLVLSQEEHGVYRTTTSGRDASGNITTAAWTRTVLDGAPSTFGHEHGYYSHFLDSNGDIYLAGHPGLACSSDGGANWHLIMGSPVGTVMGTANYIYSTVGHASAVWRQPKGCSQPTIDRTYYPPMSGVPSEYYGNTAPFGTVSTFNGTRWVINQFNYAGSINGEIWHFEE
jgi:hypothetical protein